MAGLYARLYEKATIQALPRFCRPRYGISKLKISVSRHKTAPYPKDDEQKTHPWGGLQGYADIVTLIMNRLMRYFRFTLGHPLLVPHQG